ncbi:hypothetical protein INH39_31875 [Massilia violaceinigra]|uniref:DUF3429 domain-containing protein n=1 Tax=Massilia violaceinigra TaxID=2045208 RepID=A0ABY4A6Z0_9BURK|nr:hypothetical protein [Massilia violaceinigra]UOD29910.1 hypothetical protein INH39_31875 [Massilia violaceinigra]
MSEKSSLTLAQVDLRLAIFCILILIPILPAIFWYGQSVPSVLGYFSFVLVSWGAVYAGRGVFVVFQQPVKDATAAIAEQHGENASRVTNDPQTCFWIGLGFIGAAALVLAPTMYPDNQLAACMVGILLLLFCVAFVFSGIIEYGRDGLSGFLRAILWLVLPTVTIGMLIWLFVYAR